MQAGIAVLSGLLGEFDGWEPTRAWGRAVEMGEVAERLGFSFVWVPDHLRAVEGPDDGPTFEAFSLLSAIADHTERIRLGPGVACAGFRNPALLVKMVTTLDVASGGRVDFPMGAGWFEEEWRGYGYGFPPTRDRLAQLEETLEIASRMLRPGPATWHGEHFHIERAIAAPTGLQQPRNLVHGETLGVLHATPHGGGVQAAQLRTGQGIQPVHHTRVGGIKTQIDDPAQDDAS